MSATIKIRNTEDAVATIAALAVKAIAADGHEGHSTEEVAARVLADDSLQAIRRSFTRNLAKEGATVKDAVIATGQSLVAHYCNSAGIPTSEG